MNCICNVSPTNDRVIACDKPATVKIREQRSADFKRITGRDYTLHEVCEDCAKDFVGDPRFTRID